MVGAGRIRPHDVQSAGANSPGPSCCFPESVELTLVTLILAAFIAAVGFVVVRGGGASRTRALLYALVVLVTAVGIAVLKAILAGH
jgi:hypothetical protein